ncbi:transmembrane protein 181 [Toxorhynchites rutilus septentrionalis]|uniref:transmembrane protein 181 n=1 Tax=Toxorhynchites rutilus septentrionalis TaxID=329112 RepID=UPI0024785F95|nr:transmembrane protein 181 [Toxorhynchites rutilus septentrionalis]
MTAKPPQDTTGLGYAYITPGGIFLRLRNSLSQFSDLFSEFNKYIAPAYHHDRCERSVHMRLYSMNKREFVMVFLAFFACFGLGIFIGIAGPPITTTTMVTGSSLMPNTTNPNQDYLATGPFVMKTPLMTTYSQQLWLIANLQTDNTDDEVFDKSFHVSVGIDGLTMDHKPAMVLSAQHGKNRTRHLTCSRNTCDEFIILHLGFLDYAHYIITVRFYGLEGFQHRYNINSVQFYFKTYNPAFTQIEIWFRFIFLLFTFIVTCWFAHTLRKYPIYDWSIEQKWMTILLPLLLLYNNPVFPLIFLLNSWIPGMLDAILQATFLCALLLFWLCIYHGLRQNERKLLTFYVPKLIVIMPIWLCAIVLATWEKCNEMKDPTYSHFVDTGNYNGFKTFFYIAGAMYLLYLVLLILRAYSELRSMPYFDMRLRFLTLLMLCVLAISLAVTMCRFGFGILEDNFVARLNTTYKSSAQFMCFYGLLNFYLYTMAYVYSPNGRPLHEATITKDNPAFSMINDSDEEVVYGSDEDSRRPLNSSCGKGNDYDSD